MLQYSSAFDDEVAQVLAAEELHVSPEDTLESVLEEHTDDVLDPAPHHISDEETPAKEFERGHTQTSQVHGPFYYFYQGWCFPVLVSKP